MANLVRVSASLLLDNVDSTLCLDYAIEILEVELFKLFESGHELVESLSERQWNIVPSKRLDSIWQRVDYLKLGIWSFHQTWFKYFFDMAFLWLVLGESADSTRVIGGMSRV